MPASAKASRRTPSLTSSTVATVTRSAMGPLPATRSGRPFLDGLLVPRALEDPLHEDAGRVHRVGLDGAGRDQLLDLGDRHLAGGGHHRVEVARGLAVDEVAP